VPDLSEREIEARANEVLAQYERESGKPVSAPLPIERVAHRLLGLPVSWVSLPPLPGRCSVSKFAQPELGVPARIILNLDELDGAFAECPGLERTAIGHEAGHGVFHLPNTHVAMRISGYRCRVRDSNPHSLAATGS
jgi:hypothetical protein